MRSGGAEPQTSPSLSLAPSSVSVSPSEASAVARGGRSASPQEPSSGRIDAESVLVDVVSPDRELPAESLTRASTRGAALSSEAWIPVPGDPVLYLAHEGVTAVSFDFSQQPPTAFSSCLTLEEDEIRSRFGPHCDFGFFTNVPLPLHDAPGSQGGMWSVGWFIGCMRLPVAAAVTADGPLPSTGKQNAALTTVGALSQEPLDARTLDRVGAALGVVAAEEGVRTASPETPPTRQLFPSEAALENENGSAGASLRKSMTDRTLLSPMRDEDYERGTTDASLLGDGAITLELLVGPAASDLEGRGAHDGDAPSMKRVGGCETWQRRFPRRLTLCRMSAVQPMPSSVHDPMGALADHMETLSCRSDAAAEAAFALSVAQRRRRLLQGSDDALLPLLCLQDTSCPLPTGKAPHRLLRTWAYLRTRAEQCSSSDGEETATWNALLKDVGRLAETRRCGATVFVFPESASGASALLRFLASLQPASTSHAQNALALLEVLLPLSDLGFSVDLSAHTSGAGSYEITKLWIPPEALASTKVVVVSHLARFALVARAEMEAANRRAQGVQSTWGFSALLDRLLLAESASDACSSSSAPASNAYTSVSRLLQWVTSLGMSRSSAGAMAKSVLGVSCLAAAIHADSPRAVAAARWYASEAEALLGCRLSLVAGADESAAVVTCLLSFLVHIIATGTNAQASQCAACEGRCVRLVHVPPNESTHGGCADWFADLTNDAARSRTMSHGLRSWIRGEARIEGVWHGLVEQSFAASSVCTEDSSADGSCGGPTALERLSSVLRRVLNSAAVDVPQGPSDVERLKGAFCRAVLTELSPHEVALEGGRAVRVRRLDGSRSSYAMADLFAALDALRWLHRLRREGRANGANPIVREWLRCGQPMWWISADDEVVAPAAAVIGDCHALVELTDGAAASRAERDVLTAFQLHTQVYARCLPMQAFCLDFLSPAVRCHCCCYRPDKGRGDTLGFRSPAAHRRTLYIRFLQLLAAARWTEACTLCVREMTCAREVVLGVSVVFLKQEHINQLLRMRDEVNRAAAQLLQRTGRGLLSRRRTALTDLRELRREQQHRALLSHLSTHKSAYESRDSAARALVEKTAARASAVVNADQAQLRKQAAVCSRLWMESAVTVEEELTLALEEINGFEDGMRRAEEEARGRIRAYRRMLAAEWHQQSQRGWDGYPRSLSTNEPNAAVASSRAAGVGDTAEEKLRRTAEMVASRALSSHRAAQDHHLAEDVTHHHLARQRRRFREYASRRDEREQYESSLLALGFENVTGDSTQSLAGGTRAAFRGNDVSVGGGRSPNDYCSDRDGLLHTGERQPKPHRSFDATISVFNQQRDVLSLCEEPSA